MNGLSILPSSINNNPGWKDNVMKYGSEYADDLLSPDNLDTELLCWETKWKNYHGDLPTKPGEVLSHADANYFPNIQTLLKILCTSPPALVKEVSAHSDE